MPRTALYLTLALTLIAGLGLSGCGRKGKLEPPPEQEVQGKQSEYGKKKDPGYDKPKHSLPMDILLN